MKKAILLCLIVLFQCQSNLRFKEENMIGTWKVDSIYNYTNGFGYWIAVPDWRDNIVYQYEKDGRVFQKKEEEKRAMHYRLVKDDSLVYTDLAGKFVSGYTILELTPTKLVLKKRHDPLFPGKNQEVFEIRVFSPINPSSLSAAVCP